MSDQEKVLVALEHHNGYGSCVSCPYFNSKQCRDALLRDVFDLFKAFFEEELKDE